ncbi:TMEM175 family protein [Enterococcus hirae]|nr:TMEM175 family protein [Enterococcus hirae]
MKTDRVQAFSDGIYAILITILVLQFVVPDYTAGHLQAAVFAQWPILFTYVLSFSYIGVLWLFHHDLFAHLARTTAMLNVLNMGSLFFVTLMTYATSLFAEAITHQNMADKRFAFALYALLEFLISASYYVLYSYLLRHQRLLAKSQEYAYFSHLKYSPLLGASIYLVAFIASFFSTVISLIFIVSGILFHFAAYWRASKVGRKTRVRESEIPKKKL